MAIMFFDDKSDVSTNCPNIFLNDASNDLSNSSILDSESNSDDFNNNNYPFEDKVEYPLEYYLAKVESLNMISQLQ
jgi:hypothetical protein